MFTYTCIYIYIHTQAQTTMQNRRCWALPHTPRTSLPTCQQFSVASQSCQRSATHSPSFRCRACAHARAQVHVEACHVWMSHVTRESWHREAPRTVMWVRHATGKWPMMQSVQVRRDPRVELCGTVCCGLLHCFAVCVTVVRRCRCMLSLVIHWSVIALAFPLSHTHAHAHSDCNLHSYIRIDTGRYWYGVATVSRIDKIIAIFCRILPLL